MTSAPSKEQPLAPTACSLGVKPTLQPSLSSWQTKQMASSLWAVIWSHNKTLQPHWLSNKRILSQPNWCSWQVHPLLVAMKPTNGTSHSNSRREGNISRLLKKIMRQHVSPPQISMWCVVSFVGRWHTSRSNRSYGEPSISAGWPWNGESNSI